MNIYVISCIFLKCGKFHFFYETSHYLKSHFFLFSDSKCSCGEGERPDINRSRKEAIRYKKVLASHKRKEMKMSKDDRIVNGFRDDSQHWMATFARNKRIFCGGAIISHRYIV